MANPRTTYDHTHDDHRDNGPNWTGWVIGALVALAIVIGLFFVLGGDADVDAEPGSVDVDPPALDADVDAPDVDVESPDVDVDVEPGSVDVDDADAEADAG